MNLTEKQRRLLRLGGYPALVLFVFFAALFYTFPYERLKERIIEVVGAKYDITIASISPTFWPGGVVLDTVMLETRPKKGEEPATVVVDRIKLRFGLLSGLRGRLNVDINADIGDGEIDGNVYYSKSGLEVELSTEELPMGSLPGVAEAVGLPVEGALDAEFELELPEMKWAESNGSIKFTCIDCSMGDGVSKMKLRGRRAKAFGNDGITMPKLNLGEAEGELEIKDGVGEIKTFSLKSEDGEMKLSGEIKFTDPLANSTIPGCMRLKISDALRKRSPKLDMMIKGIPPKNVDSDGFAALPTKGKLMSLRFNPKKTCDGAAGAVPSGRPSLRRRPKPSAGAAAGGGAVIPPSPSPPMSDPSKVEAPVNPLAAIEAAKGKKDAGPAKAPDDEEDDKAKDDDEDDEEDDDDSEDDDEEAEDSNVDERPVVD